MVGAQVAVFIDRTLARSLAQSQDASGSREILCGKKQDPGGSQCPKRPAVAMQSTEPAHGANPPRGGKKGLSGHFTLPRYLWGLGREEQNGWGNLGSFQETGLQWGQACKLQQPGNWHGVVELFQVYVC